MKLYQIVERESWECHAGGKAPRDVYEIASRCGFRKVFVSRETSKTKWKRCLFAVWWIIKSFFLSVMIARRAIVLVQFPAGYLRGRLGYYLLAMLRKIKGVKIVTLVHDVDALRYGYNDVQSVDFVSRIMMVSDKLIVHNQRMADWFVAQGVCDCKLIRLGIFDYLTDADMPDVPKDFHSVIVAGNLDADKTGYLAGLREIADVHWLLYGPFFDSARCCGENVDYVGCYPADELPMKLVGGFGLVWDGPSIETCDGGFGGYLRYNNPHKLSLYLASGVPVVVWNEAAEAALVLREGVGITVGSLREIGAALKSVGEDEYSAMRRRAQKFGTRLRNGEFLTAALSVIKDAWPRSVRSL